jgi:uncharacterized protein YggE
MKSIIYVLGILMLPLLITAQNKGNVNYKDRGNANYNSNNTNYQVKATKAPVSYSSTTSLTIEIAGIYNLDSDGYIAIFATTQVGTTAEETDRLINEQVSQIKKDLAGSSIKADIYVDMISFVPMYEYEVEKKVFSKKTYKEKPKGFEMKKNLHIRYQDADALEKIITACAKAEVYDLVKVDHYTEKLEQFKDEMRTKAIAILKKKVLFNKEVLSVDLNTKKRTMGEGFLMLYPVEQYNSYQAYFSSSLDAKPNSKVSNVQKSTTYYYDPVFPKVHDFIINADKIEPSMQLLYTLSVTYDMRTIEEKKVVAPVASGVKKEYILITANGQIKTLPIE